MKFSFSLNLLAVLVLAACAHQPMQKPDAAPVPTAVDNHAPEQGTGLTDAEIDPRQTLYGGVCQSVGDRGGI